MNDIDSASIAISRVNRELSLSLSLSLSLFSAGRVELSAELVTCCILSIRRRSTRRLQCRGISSYWLLVKYVTVVNYRGHRGEGGGEGWISPCNKSRCNPRATTLGNLYLALVPRQRPRKSERERERESSLFFFSFLLAPVFHSSPPGTAARP